MQNLFERYVNFEFYKTWEVSNNNSVSFERYVNFEFYKTYTDKISYDFGLRDM